MGARGRRNEGACHDRTARVRMTEEVAIALAEGRAVVALESTIISHGMPWPRNAEVALQVERAVRETGAVPATVAVIDGGLCAGSERRRRWSGWRATRRS